MDEHTISPAGDPFYAASRRTDDTIEAHYASLERACACYGGVVYIGHMVEDPEGGEEVEVYTAVPCRRCSEQTAEPGSGTYAHVWPTGQRALPH